MRLVLVIEKMKFNGVLLRYLFLERVRIVLAFCRDCHASSLRALPIRLLLLSNGDFGMDVLHPRLTGFEEQRFH